MLAVHCKKTEQLDLKSPILSYIRATYDDSEANDAEDDLAAIQGLRSEMVTAQSGSQGVRRDTLIKWVLWSGPAGGRVGWVGWLVGQPPVARSALILT